MKGFGWQLQRLRGKEIVRWISAGDKKKGGRGGHEQKSDTRQHSGTGGVQRHSSPLPAGHRLRAAGMPGTAHNVLSQT